MLELNFAPAIELIEEGGRQRSTVFTYDSWLTIWPSDPVRVDLSSSRSTFDNVRSLRERTTQTAVGISLDYMPSALTRLTARINGAGISDGNSRSTLQLEAERQVVRIPHVYAGARAERIRFERQLNRGYFNPLAYNAWLATARAWNALGNRAWWSVDGSWGRETADPGGARPRWGLGGKLTTAVTERLQAEARYSLFSSRQISGVRPDGGLVMGLARMASA